jgi:glycosyltransferase involved in cell wall biosynthesis
LEESDLKNKKLSVIIPVYNEEKSVGKVVKKVIKVLSKISDDYEILVINDGSSDKTKKAAKDAGAFVFSHPYNIGNGAAVKTGLRKAKGDIFIMMDGDGQHNPEDIPRLLKHIKEYDMVVGARSTSSEVKIHRSLANKIYNSFATYITSFKIEDLTSGFRVIKAQIAKRYLHLLPNTFSYPSTITLATIMTGHSVKYVDIKTFYRSGKSKIRLLRDGVRFFLIITKIATLFSPLRIFMPISIFFFLFGTFNYIYTYLMYKTFTNMSMLMYSTSIIIFMMGLVAEQIAQLRIEKSEK